MTDSLRMESWLGGWLFCTMGPWDDSRSQLGAIVTLGKPRGIRQHREEHRGLGLYLCCSTFYWKIKLLYFTKKKGSQGRHFKQKPNTNHRVNLIHWATYPAFVLPTCINTLVQKQLVGSNSHWEQKRMAAYREKPPRFKISHADSQSCLPAVQGSTSQIKKSLVQELLINLQQYPRAKSQPMQQWEPLQQLKLVLCTGQ